MKNLAYHKFNYLMPLYLEFAPLSMARDHIKDSKKKQDKEEPPVEAPVQVKELDEQQKQERTIFVKNLNFSTTDEMLELVFKEASTASHPLTIVSCKVVRNTKTQLSRGYGFVELSSREAAESAIKKLQNFLLEDHALKLSIAAGGKKVEVDPKKAKLEEKKKVQ